MFSSIDLLVTNQLRALVDSARPLDDGSLTWDRGYDQRFAPHQFAGCFNGRLGEALLLGFASDYVEFPGGRENAISIGVSYVKHILHHSSPRKYIAECGTGVTGLGSVLFALAALGAQCRMPELLDDVVRIVTSLHLDMVVALDKYEVFSGSAGLLLALSYLERSHGIRAPELRDGIVEHLLRARTIDVRSGCRAWATIGDRPWSGFAHGSTGVLAGLFAAGPASPAIVNAADDALAFEQSTFREQDGDWADFIAEGQTARISSWCHGAPGIALARLFLLSPEETALQRVAASDLAVSLRRTVAVRANGLTNLCCGTLGRAQILSMAGRTLENQSLQGVAQAALADCAERLAADQIRFVQYEGDGAHMQAGLWQGRTGVIWSLLPCLGVITPMVLTLGAEPTLVPVHARQASS